MEEANLAMRMSDLPPYTHEHVQGVVTEYT
jgi:hypothetical protein